MSKIDDIINQIKDMFDNDLDPNSHYIQGWSDCCGEFIEKLKPLIPYVELAETLSKYDEEHIYIDINQPNIHMAKIIMDRFFINEMLLKIKEGK